MSLSSSEHVLYQTRMSKRIFWKPAVASLVIVALAIVLRVLVPDYGVYLLWGLIGLAVLILIPPLTRYWFSHYVLTDQRVIIRHGFLTRTTYEMILEKIESIAVNQSLSDRLLWGSGTLVITGTGGTKETFPDVGGAVQFQDHLNEALHSMQGRQE